MDEIFLLGQKAYIQRAFTVSFQGGYWIFNWKPDKTHNYINYTPPKLQQFGPEKLHPGLQKGKL